MHSKYSILAVVDLSLLEWLYFAIYVILLMFSHFLDTY